MSNDKDFKVKNGVKPTVYHEAMGTVVSGSVGYSLANASLTGATLNVSSQDNQGQSLFFKPDGTKLYYLGSLNDRVYQYTLSTPWNLSTASYDSVFFSVGTQATVPLAVRFRPDGFSFYVLDANDTIYQYNMVTAYDLSTASYASKSFSAASQDSQSGSIDFKTDGTRLYVSGEANDRIYQYSLSTAWDISTASYSGVSFSISPQEVQETDLYFKSDGLAFYLLGDSPLPSDNTGKVYEYALTTAWDISTASYTGDNTTITQDPNAFYLSSDGTKMYVIDYITEVIEEYSITSQTLTLDLSTGSVFEITPSSNIQLNLSNPADSGTVSGATLLLEGGVAGSYDLLNAVYDGKSFYVGSQDTLPFSINISADGTKMYFLGNTTDTVYEYNLSTPYDISSASYNSVNFSVTSQAPLPKGVTFNLDGTKMYVLESAVYQYVLSTPWDLSTASYEGKTLTISGQTSNARGIQISNDGTSLFIGSIAASDGIFQYTLSTAFDISTGSYASKFLNVISQAGEMSDFDFNADGTKVFVVDFDDNDVHQYSLSTAFDISTAAYDSVVFNPSEGGVSSCRGMTFADSGNKLYQLISTGTTVYQYSSVIPATITYDTNIQWAGGAAPTSPSLGDTDVLVFSTRDGGTTYKAALAIDGAA